MAVGGVWGELVSGGRSLISRENTGNSPKFERSGETRAEFPKLLYGDSDEFPVTENRESIPASREFARIRSGL
jgi:hypothetical protein